MSENSELQEKREAFKKKLAKLGITDRQTDLLVGIFDSRPSDDLADIATRLNPPMKGNAARQMLYRLREKYRKQKRFTNIYEDAFRIMKTKRFRLM